MSILVGLLSMELISDRFVLSLISFPSGLTGPDIIRGNAGHFHPPEGIPGIFRLDDASRETGVDSEHIFQYGVLRLKSPSSLMHVGTYSLSTRENRKPRTVNGELTLTWRGGSVTHRFAAAKAFQNIPPKHLLLLRINQKFVNKTNLPVTLHRLRGYKSKVFIEHLFHSAI